jgi:hypothetical protein
MEPERTEVLPDEETVQVGICPLLTLPPVVQFALLLRVSHGACGGRLGDDPQEQCTPVHSGLVGLKGRRKLELESDAS